MGDFQKLFQAFGSLSHDVGANDGDIPSSLFLMIQRRDWHEVAFEAVASPATQNQVLQFSRETSLGAGDEVIFRSHHEAIIVCLKIEAAIDTTP